MRQVWVPEVLKKVQRGAPIKVWVFLYVNQPMWFTGREIAEYLGIPVSSVLCALKEVRKLPKIGCKPKKEARAGRKELMYRFSEREVFFG